MEILNVAQIQEWDKFTIDNEPILSIDLMERASLVFTNWLIDQFFRAESHILIVVSRGNNGGDGLVVARKLAEYGLQVTVLICMIQKEASEDFNKNLERLKTKNVHVLSILPGDKLLDLSAFDAIVDGIFGSGLTRPVSDYWAEVIHQLNASGKRIYSIDIPSGMFGDSCTPKNSAVIHAYKCLSFERPKLSFFFPSNQNRIPDWSFKSIGLLSDYLENKGFQNYLLESRVLGKVLKVRDKFDHKGSFGKALFIAGQKGMMGAAVLCASSMIRSGVGLSFGLIPDCGYDILQSRCPESQILHGFGDEYLKLSPDVDAYDSIAIGPGLGIHAESYAFLHDLFKKIDKPCVIDADALNIISKHPDLWKDIPPGSILTPHPGEFRRLFGNSKDDLEEIELLRKKAIEHELIILLKGAYTIIASPDGNLYFNACGNPGMATAGSGDVLTGLIGGFLAQSYTALESAKLGVHLHALAGDYAAKEKGMEAMIASDIIDNLGKAFQKLWQYSNVML